MNKALKILIIFAFTYLSMMLLCININLTEITYGYKSFLTEMNQILNSFDIVHIIIGFMIYYFYYKVYFIGEKFTKKNIIISFISVVLSILIVIGKFLEIEQIFPNFSNESEVFICILIFTGAYLAFYAVIKTITNIDFSVDLNIKKKKKISSKQNSIFKQKVIKISNYIKRHPIFSVFVLIMLCRLPYLIICYPGTGTGDTLDQLCQFFNRTASWSKDFVFLNNKNVYLNNHHPIFSTLFLGLFVKIGELIKSRNFGLFLYTLFQTITTSLIFSYVLHYIKKLNVPKVIYIVSLLLICLNPFLSSYVISIIKDTPEAILTLIYVILLLEIVRDYNNIFSKKNMIILLILVMIFMMLFRHNGIITIILSYPLLFILYKKHYRKILIVLLIPIIVYFSFNQIMYTCFNASKGSKMEMLSVPFMQIARVVNRRGENAIEVSDQKKINRILKYNKLKDKYFPDLADDVKFTYRQDATNKELSDFFIVWAKYFKKYPTIYIASFINSTYQYFYPYEFYENLFLGFDIRITKEFSELRMSKNYIGIIENFKLFVNILTKLPIIGIVFYTSFYDWILLFSMIYITYRKKYKYLIPLMPLLAVLLVALAGPINGSMRYILPILFSFPVILSIDYLVYKESK